MFLCDYYVLSFLEFLDYDTVMEICQDYNLLCCSPLLRGNFNEAMNVCSEFLSTIPLKFSLPQISVFPNFAEGVIIKPLKNTFKITSKGMKRLIFKRKHPNFVEKKFHRATVHKVPYNSKIDVSMEAKYELFALINSNRIQSAISKLGFPKTDSELYNLFQFVIDEIFVEFANEQSETYSLLNDGVLLQLRSLCISEVQAILDEEFNIKKH